MALERVLGDGLPAGTRVHIVADAPLSGCALAIRVIEASIDDAGTRVIACIRAGARIEIVIADAAAGAARGALFDALAGARASWPEPDEPLLAELLDGFEPGRTGTAFAHYSD